MSKDPVITDLERAVALAQQGNVTVSLGILKSICANHRSHAAAFQAALIWAQLEPQNPDSLLAIATGHMFQGRFAEAAQGFELFLMLQPSHPVATTYLAICIRMSGDLQRALVLTEEAIRLNDGELDAHLNYLDLLNDMGNYEEGLAYAQSLLKKFTNHPSVHTNLARFYMILDRHAESEPHHLQAIKLNPGDAAPQIGYLNYLLQENNEPAVIKQLGVLNRLFTQNPHYQALLQDNYKKVLYHSALAEGRLMDAHAKILKMRDIDRMEYDDKSLKIVDKSKPAWLLKGQDLKCFSTDTIFYDDELAYLNMQVTGRWHIFSMALGIHNSFLVDENFPRFAIDESCIFLANSTNYYHWLIDCLPRLEALTDHPELSALPIYMNYELTAFHKESLTTIGIDLSRIKIIPHNSIAVFKDVFIPYVPGRLMLADGQPDWMKPNDNPFIIEWIRRKFYQPNESTPKKRYFISRAGAEFRRCINEEEIFAIAQEYGFEKLANEKKSFADQIALYNSAEAIMGPHGAGFTNMLFAPKDAVLFELLPKARQLTFFESICRQIGQTYITLKGPVVRTFSDKPSNFGDFYIDPIACRALLQKHFG